jgi:hypothetical protein
MDIKAFVVTKEEMQTKESLNKLKLMRARTRSRENVGKSIIRQQAP